MFKKGKVKSPKPLTATSVSANNASSDTAIFLNLLNDPEVIERVRAMIKNAHVFKLPTRQTVSVGWRGADWKDKIWQGTIKVVERGDMTAVILENSDKKTIFAVCPIREGAVDRCVDSSRYFVLRIENATGRHMFVGVAFNERNDAFDFNTALEDSRRERATELAHQSAPSEVVPGKDYRLKEGEKIHIKISGTEDKKDPQFTTAAFANFHGNVTGSPDEISQNKEPNNAANRRRDRSRTKQDCATGGLLLPSAKDTPTRSPAVQSSSAFFSSFVRN